VQPLAAGARLEAVGRGLLLVVVEIPLHDRGAHANRKILEARHVKLLAIDLEDDERRALRLLSTRGDHERRGNNEHETHDIPQRTAGIVNRAGANAETLQPAAEAPCR